MTCLQIVRGLWRLKQLDREFLRLQQIVDLAGIDGLVKRDQKDYALLCKAWSLMTGGKQ